MTTLTKDGYSPSEIPRLLHRLKRQGIEFSERCGELLIEGDVGALPAVDAEELHKRRAEILAHLHGSPGRRIAGYPEHYKLHTHKFQELLIEDHDKRGWILEAKDGTRRWLHEPTEERMREIAMELGEVRVLCEILLLRVGSTTEKPRSAAVIADMANVQDLPTRSGGCWTAQMIDEVLRLAGPERKGETLFQTATRVANQLEHRPFRFHAPSPGLRRSISSEAGRDAS